MLTFTLAKARATDLEGRKMSRAAPPIPTAWTPIATRPRQTEGYELLQWEPLVGAPYTVATARRLSRAGVLVMANRHHPDRVELVVKAAPASGG